MMEWIITSSVLILVVAALRTVLKGKISLRLQYALWGLVLVRLLLPISLFDSGFSVMNAVEHAAPALTEDAGDVVLGYRDYITPDLSVVEPDPNMPPEEQEKQYEENLTAWKAEMEAAKAETGTPVTVGGILKALWLVGSALVALWFLAVNLRFGIKLRKDRTAVAVEDYPLPVYCSAQVETPCLYGLFRPVVYLTDEVTEETMGHVLAHELTHYRHGDHVWSALRCLCLTLHWYNPLVWLAACLSRRDAELACDEGALRCIGEEQRTAYGHTLIGLTCRRRSNLALTATTMTGSKKGIAERILLIAKKPQMKKWTLAVLLVLVIVAAGCTFSGAGEDTAVQPSGQESPDPQPTESMEMLDNGWEGVGVNTDIVWDADDPLANMPNTAKAFEEYGGGKVCGVQGNRLICGGIGVSKVGDGLIIDGFKYSNAYPAGQKILIAMLKDVLDAESAAALVGWFEELNALEEEYQSALLTQEAELEAARTAFFNYRDAFMGADAPVTFGNVAVQCIESEGTSAISISFAIHNKEIFVGPEDVQSWADWSEEDIARWRSETDSYGLTIQTSMSLFTFNSP